jgi:hypothetical protein
MTNIATTKRVTRSDSVGMRLISCDQKSMPAGVNDGFDLYQTRRDLR